jgi:hypothetical protein
MNVKIGNNIGPWVINKILKTEYTRSILQVFLNKDFDHLIDSELGGVKYWIMKISQECDEYEKIKKYKLDECEYTIKTLNNNDISNGKYDEKYYWYIIEEYCFDCSRKIIGLTNIEKKLIPTIINFLRYLHIKQKAIYGDLKLKNVLYKNGNYVMCDFESIKNPNNDELCDEYKSSNYYYYYIGCEYNKPIWSYRTDLEAVGYILWYIINGYKFLDFQVNAQYYYEKDYEANRYSKLESLKYNDFENMPLIVNKYFEIISRIDWFNLEPPSSEIYDEIIKLLDN